MTVDGSKFCIKYLNELVDQYKYTYRHSICRKSIIASYPALIEKIRRILKLLNLKLMIEEELITIINLSREVFIIDSVLKTNPWTCKNKDLNIENLIESSYEEVLLTIEVMLSKLYMSYHQEPDSYIRDKFKVVFNFSNHAIKNESGHATVIF